MAFYFHTKRTIGVPRPPVLRPTWTTWMWIGLAVAVAVLTVIGLWYAAVPYML